ncbi:MAG TPA: FAD-dependent monooxygenase, partial [Brevibacterium sp.]|nr:FAD-dependent monooxygenase [Brevibacterium sp.]
MRVAVVGSGIGGLCAAVGLQRAGAEVVVFEKAQDPCPGGSGLSVFGNGIRALESLGLGAGFRAITDAKAASFRGGQRRPDGSWLSVYPMDVLTELRVVDRAELHELLTSSLAPGTVSAGQRVASASEEASVRYAGADERAEAERFDLVIGADGLRSAVRGLWPEDPGVVYAGYSTWRGITERPMDLGGEAGETWGAGRRFGVAPLADGRVYWFAVATMPEPSRSRGETPLDRTFGTWHAPIADLVAATAADRVQFLPIEELGGRLQSYVRGRTVLLGDAAHAMTPNLGQGGGQAMEDAATLVALLAPSAAAERPDPTSLTRALERYDALRRPRSQGIARRSRLVGKLAHGRGPVASRVGGMILAATPRAVLHRQLTWLQSWTPPGA